MYNQRERERGGRKFEVKGYVLSIVVIIAIDSSNLCQLLFLLAFSRMISVFLYALKLSSRIVRHV